MKAVVLFSLLAGAAWAQGSNPPTFEVASVKVAAPFKPGDGVVRGCGKPDPALVHCTGVPLRALLMRAYGVKPFQVEGPAWINSEPYDIMAKVPEGTPADQVPAMLQALLAERFAVKVHKETRVLPVYELNVAKGGPKMKEVELGKIPVMEPGQAAPPLPRPGANGPPPVNSLPVGAILMMVNANGARTVRGNMTIDQLVNHFATTLERPVVDATGLKGTYEIDLTYLGDESDGAARMFAANGPPGAGPGGRGEPAPQQDASTPTATVFQAVQQNLGLRLDPKKAPVDYLVVDSANKVPTEN